MIRIDSTPSGSTRRRVANGARAWCWSPSPTSGGPARIGTTSASDLVQLALTGQVSRSGRAGREPLPPPPGMSHDASALQVAWAALVAYFNRLVPATAITSTTRSSRQPSRPSTRRSERSGPPPPARPTPPTPRPCRRSAVDRPRTCTRSSRAPTATCGWSSCHPGSGGRCSSGWANHRSLPTRGSRPPLLDTPPATPCIRCTRSCSPGSRSPRWPRTGSAAASRSPRWPPSPMS